MNNPPNHKYALEEFKFQLLCHLQVFEEHSVSVKTPTKLLATASKYGLIFVGYSKGIQCLQTNSIIKLQNERPNNRGKISSYPKRELPLSSPPSHIDVSSDGESLAFTNIQQECPVLSIFSIPSFGTAAITKKCEVRLGSTPGVTAVDLQWNPGVSNMIGAVMSDGSAIVCEFTPNGPSINSIPPNSQSSCLCWSPKGKRVIIGSKNGSLSQYLPDLKIVKAFPPPSLQGKQVGVVSLRWLSNTQYIVTYKDLTDPSATPIVMVVNAQGQTPNFVNYDDICCGSLYERPEHFFIHQPAWNIIIVGSGNALETTVLRLESDTWVQWIIDDGNRADLPLTEDHQDVHNIGMAFDLSPQQPVPIGENKVIDPAPLLLMLSHAGVLCLFHTINNTPNASKLTIVPQNLSPQFFTEKNAGSGSPHIGATTPGVAPAPATAAQDKVQFKTPSFSLGSQQMPVAASQPAATFQLSQQQSLQQPLQQPSGQQSQLMFSLSQPTLQSTQFSFKVPTQNQMQSTVQTQPIVSSPLQQQQNQSPVSATKTTQSSAQSFGFSSLGGFGQSNLWLHPQTDTQIQNKQSFFSQPTKSPSADKTSAPANKTTTAGTTFVESGFVSLGVSGSQGSPLGGFKTTTINKTPQKPQAVDKNELSSSQPSVQQNEETGQVPKEGMTDPLETKGDGDSEEVREKERKKSIMQAINKEIQLVCKEIAESQKKIAPINKNIPPVDESILNVISTKLGDLQIFQKDLVEVMNAQLSEVTTLRCNLVEIFGWIETIKARERQMQSQRYQECMESQSLDPVIKSRLKNIDTLIHFLDTQLKQATSRLDSMWACHVNSKNKEKFEIPNMEAMYESILNQSYVLATLKAAAGEVESKIKNSLAQHRKKIPQVIEHSTPYWESNKTSDWSNKSNSSELDLLAEKLLTTKIKEEESSKSFKETSCRYIILANSQKNLEPALENTLKNWHKTHKIIRTKTVKPYMPIGDFDFSEEVGEINLAGRSLNESLSSGKNTITTQVKPVTSRSLFTLSNSKPIAKQQIFPSGTENIARDVNTENVSSFVKNPSITNNSITFDNALVLINPKANNLIEKAASPKELPLLKNASQSSAVKSPGESNSTSTPIKSTQSADAKTNNTAFSLVQLSFTSANNSVFGNTSASTWFSSTPSATSKPVRTSTGTSFSNTVTPPSASTTTVSSTKPSQIFNQFSFAPPSSNVSQYNEKTIFSNKSTNANSSIGPSSTASAQSSASTTKTGFPLFFGNSQQGNSQQANIFGNTTSISSSTSLAPNVSLFRTGTSSTFTNASSLINTNSTTLASTNVKTGSATTSSAITTTTSVFTSPVSSHLSFDMKANPSTASISPANTACNTASFSALLSGTSLQSSSLSQSLIPPSTVSVVATPQSLATTTAPSAVSTGTLVSSSAAIGSSPLTSKNVFITTVSPGSIFNSTSLFNTTPSTATIFGNVSSPLFTSATTTSSVSSTSPAVTASQIFGNLISTPSIFSPPGVPVTASKSSDTTTSPSSVPATTTTSNTGSIFGSTTSGSSIFANQSPSVFAPTNTTPTTPAMFGVSATIFGSTASTSTTSIFGSTPPATVSTYVFGNTATSVTTTNSIFGNASSTVTSASTIFGAAAATTSSTPIFGGSVTTSATSVFSTPSSITTPSSPMFRIGTPTTTSSATLFGAGAPTTTSSKSIFGAPTTTSSSLFGGTAQPTTSVSIFGGASTTAMTSSTSVFSGVTSTTSTTSIFGGSTTTTSPSSGFETPTPATTSSSSIFGNASTTSSIFGTPTTTSSSAVFGAAQALSSTSFFGTPSSSSNTFGTGAQTSPFSSQTKSFSTPFFQNTSSSNVFSPDFGQKPTTTAAASIFGGGGTPTFGQSGGNLFGNAPNQNKFASSGSLFGSNTTFGSPSQSGFASGQSGSIFGNTTPNAFSGGTQQNVAQTGFGGPATFGASGGSLFGGQASFGSPPIFGGSATFGSPKKVFGESSPGSTTFGSPTQQSSTFENLAGQNTITFGNLAQTQPGFNTPPPSFGGGASPQQTFPATSTFGGSSFSTWR